VTDSPTAPGGRAEEPVVIRDKRKIDPVTGQVRAATGGPTGRPSPVPAGGEQAGPDPLTGPVPMVEASLLEERTTDLQRLQAEYANYRKRIERDRLAAGELATGRVLTALLPVLDDIDRARSHGDLTGGLKAVADQLDAVLGKLGLVAFGELGDRFDPAIHEAVMHTESDDVTEASCTTILRPGYKHGERLLRAAMVGVSEPATPAEPEPPAAPAQGDAGPAPEEVAGPPGDPSASGGPATRAGER
jgi:molecular chaperone GrpE